MWTLLVCTALALCPATYAPRPGSNALGKAPHVAPRPGVRPAMLEVDRTSANVHSLAVKSHTAQDKTGIMLQSTHKVPDKVHYQGRALSSISYVPFFFRASFLVAVLIVVIIGTVVYLRAKDVPNDGVDEEQFTMKPCPLNEDFFAMSLCVYVRHQQRLQAGSKHKMIRVLHVVTVMLVVVFSLLIEVYFVYVVWDKLALPAQEAIRREYDMYEMVMYDNKTVTVKDRFGTSTGVYHRGIVGEFNPSNFDKLDEATKGLICQIPFSCPVFLMLMLTVWAFNVLIELRECVELGFRLLINTPTIGCMADALEDPNSGAGTLVRAPKRRGKRGPPRQMSQQESEEDDHADDETCTDQRDENKEGQQPQLSVVEEVPELTIVGLTGFSKLLVFFVIILPRLAVSVLLLWIGSIWLASTTNFENMVANVVALAFIIQFPTMMYQVVAPERSQMVTQRTNVQRLFPRSPLEVGPILGAFSWCLWGVFWAYAFVILFQPVLPDYRWDVRAICQIRHDLFTHSLSLE